MDQRKTLFIKSMLVAVFSVKKKKQF